MEEFRLFSLDWNLNQINQFCWIFEIFELSLTFPQEDNNMCGKKLEISDKVLKSWKRDQHLSLSLYSCLEIKDSVQLNIKFSSWNSVYYLIIVHFHVITLTIPILGLRIISESCQSPHIIHHWNEGHINNIDKVTYKRQRQWQRQKA